MESAEALKLNEILRNAPKAVDMVRRLIRDAWSRSRWRLALLADHDPLAQALIHRRAARVCSCLRRRSSASRSATRLPYAVIHDS